MTDKIVALPDSAKSSKARRELARWLRELAGYIEADWAETEPHAALIVLTGRAQQEVLYAGYDGDGNGLSGAVFAAQAVVNAYFPTVGGNVRPRDWLCYGGEPPNKHNVVDFGPPRRKPMNDGGSS